MNDRISCLVLGGTGYVAGELLRLLAGHPHFRVKGVVSTSSPGEAVEAVFPHLYGAHPTLNLSPRDAVPDLIDRESTLAVFSAGPHGESAGEIDAVLRAGEAAGVDLRLVDLSADFRYASVEEYEAVYGVSHGAPHRIPEFICAVPELAPDAPARHACHPGCFTTSVVLPTAALVRLRLIETEIHVSAVTGSTGAGRTPRPTTHHPERQSNLFAYSPLSHRHGPEMECLVEAAGGTRPAIHFVPHSGPFARGIHATLHATLKKPMSAGAVAEALSAFYENAPFVTVTTAPPRLKEVVGTNHCRLGVAVRGRHLVVLSVLDNMVKGAAGGAVQWMNRLHGFKETAGLVQPGLGWL